MSSTICALATAPDGALGIIRISGPQTLEILTRIFSKDLRDAQPNTIHYGHIIDQTSNPTPPLELCSLATEGTQETSNLKPPLELCSLATEGTQETSNLKPQTSNLIDEVLVSVFRAPHSYTGEDSAEISCHGSRYILNKVLELLIQNGCRMAEPGEYTQRAFLNGKMDLSQAEAVADLIASSNKASHQLAISQLRGGISSELSRLREQLLKLTSLLELELDFSDHEDLEFADRSELFELTKEIDSHILRLAHTFEAGQAIKQGIPVAIIGKTNVGKSTLLNRLLHEERAIVSDVHGTTRDTIEDTIDIQGVTFRFIDTAGIRQTTDTIEQIGISRTYAAIEKARIVLWLIDAEPSPEEVQEIQERCQDKSLIIIQNKMDLSSLTSHLSPLTSHLSPLTSHLSPLTTHLLKISAKHGTNIDALEQAIYQAANIPTITDSDIIVSNARHYNALLSAHQNISRVLEGMGGTMTHGEWSITHESTSGDLLSEDLKLVLDDLADITGQGRIVTNEILSNIFTHFCVGK